MTLTYFEQNSALKSQIDIGLSKNVNSGEWEKITEEYKS